MGIVKKLQVRRKNSSGIMLELPKVRGASWNSPLLGLWYLRLYLEVPLFLESPILRISLARIKQIPLGFQGDAVATSPLASLF